MKDKWFGLIEVRQQKNSTDILDGAVGAFVNILALATSEEEYEVIVRSSLEEFGLYVLSMEEVCLISDLKKTGRIFDDELLSLEGVLTDEAPIQYDEFQAYMEGYN